MEGTISWHGTRELPCASIIEEMHISKVKKIVCKQSQENDTIHSFPHSRMLRLTCICLCSWLGGKNFQAQTSYIIIQNHIWSSAIK
jgi:hypothetical protein